MQHQDYRVITKTGLCRFFVIQSIVSLSYGLYRGEDMLPMLSAVGVTIFAVWYCAEPLEAFVKRMRALAQRRYEHVNASKREWL